VFKAHLSQCSPVQKEPNDIQIKLIQTSGDQVTALVNYCRITWQIDFQLKTFIAMIKHLQTEMPGIPLFA